MTAIAMNYADHPYWERSITEFQLRPRVEIVSKPWGNSVISSGGYYSSPFEVSPESGVTRWLDDILSLPDESQCPLTTPEVPAALAEIRDAFSLNVVQLAQIFGVSRQAIYDWREEKPVKTENRQRIATIRSMARLWTNIYPKPVGRVVAEEIDGMSLLTLLSADQADESAITQLFHKIAERLATAEANRPPSARELIDTHGMQPLSDTDHRRNVKSAFLKGRRGR